MSVIDEIKARIDIVDLVSETVQLRRSGKNYTGFCPFHANTRTPAFVVFPESGTWRCFGQCNEGGDIFGYVMKKENVGFPRSPALPGRESQASSSNRSPPGTRPSPKSTTACAACWKRPSPSTATICSTHPAGKIALEYLHKRGLKDETIEAFGLGYAPDAWEEALRHFKSKGYSEETCARPAWFPNARQSESMQAEHEIRLAEL